MLFVLSIPLSSPALAAINSEMVAGQIGQAGGVDQPGPKAMLWVDLTRGERAAADKLGYNQEAWDAGVIRKPNDEVNNFWHGYAYNNLTKAERAAWAVLGWNNGNWIPTVDVPRTEYIQWAKLEPAEQAAATALGYAEGTWGKYVRIPTGNVEDFWLTIDEHGG